jgi:hypothetical protein
MNDQTTTNAPTAAPVFTDTAEYWTSALAAAEDAIASPRPARSDYSRGEFGEDQYMVDVETWEARQRVAYRLQRLAQRRLAVLA